eukprot:symbB.v1.2.017199.t1/scaffold1338.1/size124487/2
MFKTVKYTDSVNSLEMFLKGDYMVKTEQDSSQRENAKVVAFDEACRQSAQLLGVCQAATAAASMADAVAEDIKGAKGTRCCRSSGVAGLRTWLKAPFYCRVWRQAFHKAKSYGLRMTTAMVTIGLVYALARPNAIWPHAKGPLWTLVTVVLILTPVTGASLQRSLRRFCGTLLGSCVALGSIALVGQPDLRIFSTHIFALCFALKFFEPELQYAGAVAFVTYMVIIFSLSDELYDLENLEAPKNAELLELSFHLALRRCCDVSVGVLTAMVVSIFIAPDRAVDELRSREEEALKGAAKGMKAACRLLAWHASNPPRDAMVEEKDLVLDEDGSASSWSELRKEGAADFFEKAASCFIEIYSLCLLATMGLTSDHIPVEEMLRSSSLWLEKLLKASNANEEMNIFASYLINILAKNADPMDGNKIAKYSNYTNKRLCYGEDGQGEEWPQAPDISDRNLLAQAHHLCPLRRGTGKSHVVRRMIIYVELLDQRMCIKKTAGRNHLSCGPSLALPARAKAALQVTSMMDKGSGKDEIWNSFESLNFAGDGRPGVGDVLEDARWESRWGVDRGVLLLGGLLWLPGCWKGPPKGKHCLDAVPILSRLLRSVQVLVGICQSDFGEDAKRPLCHDAGVFHTLGANGSNFTHLLDSTLSSAVNLLQGRATEMNAERLEEQMTQLFTSAANSRLMAGGLVGSTSQLGGMKAAAALKLLELCVQNFVQICRQLEGGEADDATMSAQELRTSHSDPLQVDLKDMDKDPAWAV